MAKARITEVMMDDTSINVSKEVDLVFSIANSLRGAYKSDKYKDVIIPMIIIRRFECALAKKKDAVVAAFKLKRDTPPQILESISGYKFYNTSDFSLGHHRELLLLFSVLLQMAMWSGKRTMVKL